MSYLPSRSQVLAPVLALALAAGSSTLLAQPADRSEPAQREDGEAGKGKSARPVTALSVGDMQVQLAAMADRLKADARHVMHLRELARKQKDVIKLTCVNDKAIQLKAQQNIFGAAQLQLTAALTDDQTDRFDLFAQVSVTADSGRKLREEAEACLGEGDLGPSESAVDVTTPDIIDDPTKSDSVFDPNLEPPGYASPYR
jgi:hypothetical protein